MNVIYQLSCRTLSTTQFYTRSGFLAIYVHFLWVLFVMPNILLTCTISWKCRRQRWGCRAVVAYQNMSPALTWCTRLQYLYTSWFADIKPARQVKIATASIIEALNTQSVLSPMTTYIRNSCRKHSKLPQMLKAATNLFTRQGRSRWLLKPHAL